MINKFSPKTPVSDVLGTAGPTCAYPAVPGFWPCKCIQLQDRKILEQSAQSSRAKHIAKKILKRTLIICNYKK